MPTYQDLIASPWLYAIAVAVLGFLIHLLFFQVACRIARRTHFGMDDALLKRSYQPTRLILPLLLARLVLRGFMGDADEHSTGLVHLIDLALIAGSGWFLVSLTYVLHDIVDLKYDVTLSDNYTARRVQTQVQVLRRITSTLIILVTIAAMLMTFDSVRAFGQTVLASAGLAGIIAGLAARPTVSNLIAGMQIAMTQPIRIDDVVIVEGEWGRIEEITNTYVVVKIWDQRRLVVPLTYFIEQPFQNWTRRTADILGTVFLYLDYRTPIDPIRTELIEYVKKHPKWDGKVCGLQVTDCKERVIEVRCLVSSSNAGLNFDLRCDVREHIIQFIQEKYPESLPRTRIDGDLRTSRDGPDRRNPRESDGSPDARRRFTEVHDNAEDRT